VVRAGNGGHDPIAILPRALSDDLKRQARGVRALHDEEVRDGAGWVTVPGALARKMPSWDRTGTVARMASHPCPGTLRARQLQPRNVAKSAAAAVWHANVVVGLHTERRPPTKDCPCVQPGQYSRPALRSSNRAPGSQVAAHGRREVDVRRTADQNVPQFGTTFSPWHVPPVTGPSMTDGGSYEGTGPLPIIMTCA